MVKWYDLLLTNEVEIKLSENPEQDATSAAHEVATPKTKAKETKAVSVKAAPPKKIGSSRNMA